MKINFVTVANEGIASYRYHNQIPANQLKELGHEVNISPMPSLDADIYCFSKHFNSGDYWYMRGLQAEGKKTVFHCCDNHFNTKMADHYHRMIKGVDKVIASTEELASVIKIETGVNATVIYDPYEMEEAEPRFKPNGKLKLLWYGHPSNIQPLLDIWPRLGAYNVMIMSDPNLTIDIEGGKGQVPVAPWSMKNVNEALDQCDAVIIPSAMGERQNVKSPNRLVEAIRKGKYVLADPLPSYQVFDKWAWIGDIEKGLGLLESQDKDVIEGRIRDAQAYIRENHSPELIGKQWEGVLDGRDR
jgi:hypothetical protein